MYELLDVANANSIPLPFLPFSLPSDEEEVGEGRSRKSRSVRIRSTTPGNGAQVGRYRVSNSWFWISYSSAVTGSCAHWRNTAMAGAFTRPWSRALMLHGKSGRLYFLNIRFAHFVNMSSVLINKPSMSNKHARTLGGGDG